MTWAFAAVGLLGVLAWGYAAVQYVGLLRHRRADVTLSSLLVGGMKAFDPRWFTGEGVAYQRRFGRAFAAFFACLALMLFLALFGTLLES
jgi:hypothetical protein